MGWELSGVCKGPADPGGRLGGGIRRVRGPGWALDSILPVTAGPGGHLPSNGIPPRDPLGWGEAGPTEQGRCPQHFE